MLNKRTARIWAIFFAVSLFANYGFAQLAIQESKWDWALPSMELTDVTVEGDSLTEAWQEMTWKYSLRSILYVGKDMKNDESQLRNAFSLSVAELTAGSLLDSFSKHYAYEWTQDEKTGVIWLYPDEYEYTDLLSGEVSIEKDMLAVPLQTGILEPLSRDSRLGVIDGPMSTFSLATFNYNVNIPSDTYSIRELLNLASVANPTKTFVISEDLVGYDIDEIMPLNVLTHKVKSLTPGAILFWETELGTLGEPIPTSEVLMARLSDPDPSIRKKARQYAITTLWTGSISYVIENAAHPSGDKEEDLWIATTYLYAYINDDYRRIPKEIRQLLDDSLTEEFVRTGSPQIVLLAGLARLAEAGAWSLTTPVEHMLSARHFTAQELRGIEEDVAHIALRSKFVFRALTDKGHSGYIDTSGWAQSFLGGSYEESRTLQFTNPDVDSRFESSSSKWLLGCVIAILLWMPVLIVGVLRRKSKRA